MQAYAFHLGELNSYTNTNGIQFHMSYENLRKCITEN